MVLSLGAAVTQAAQFAVVKGRARALPPRVIVLLTQGVAIRRTSALIAVILGATLFREPDLPRRLAAAGLACAGAACLLFAR